jgi:hypothetical protein
LCSEGYTFCCVGTDFFYYVIFLVFCEWLHLLYSMGLFFMVVVGLGDSVGSGHTDLIWLF